MANFFNQVYLFTGCNTYLRKIMMAPGKTARSKPGFLDEILTLIRAPRPGLVRVSSGLILTLLSPRPGLVRIDFNPNKALSESRPAQF